MAEKGGNKGMLILIVGGGLFLVGLVVVLVIVKNASEAPSQGIQSTSVNRDKSTSILDVNTEVQSYIAAMSVEKEDMNRQIKSQSRSLLQVQERMNKEINEIQTNLKSQDGIILDKMDKLIKSNAEFTQVLTKRMETVEIQMRAFEKEKRSFIEDQKNILRKMKSYEKSVKDQAASSKASLAMTTKKITMDLKGSAKTSEDEGMTYDAKPEDVLGDLGNSLRGGEGSASSDLDPLAAVGAATPTYTTIKPLVKIELNKNSEKKQKFGSSKYSVILPAGSEAKAKLVYGVHAPVGGNPAPMILKVKGKFFGPNGSSLPLNDVVVIAKAVGQKAKSRALVQVTTISGVTAKGKAFAVKANGYVIGKDAIAGIEGKLLDSPPNFFFKYTGMGALSAAAAALSDSTTETRVDSTGQQFTNIKPGKVAQNAAYTGLSNAISKSADVVNRRLESWEEIVVVDGDQEVVVVILEPVKLEAYDADSFSTTMSNHEGLY